MASMWYRGFVNFVHRSFNSILEDLNWLKNYGRTSKDAMEKMAETLADVYTKLDSEAQSSLDLWKNVNILITNVHVLSEKIDSLSKKLNEQKVNLEANMLREELNARTRFYENVISKLIDAKINSPFAAAPIAATSGLAPATIITPLKQEIIQQEYEKEEVKNNKLSAVEQYIARKNGAALPLP